MSEFTDVAYLRSEKAQEGEALLRRAGLSGYVFEAKNGWVAMVPLAPMGSSLDALAPFNEQGRLLVSYLLAVDFGWRFIAAKGEELLGTCSWGDDGAGHVQLSEPIGAAEAQILREAAGDSANPEAWKRFFEPSGKGGEMDFEEQARTFAQAMGFPHASFVSIYHLGEDLDAPNASGDELAQLRVVKAGEA